MSPGAKIEETNANGDGSTEKLTADTERIECCVGGHVATRRVYPNLDYDNGVYAVCDSNDHLPIPVSEISEIEPIALPETFVAQGLGVRVTITTSAGTDGAVLVLIDTEFEPDASDGGPGLRVNINDDTTYVGVAYLQQFDGSPDAR